VPTAVGEGVGRGGGGGGGMRQLPCRYEAEKTRGTGYECACGGGGPVYVGGGVFPRRCSII
jgi:hypothetical protein